MSTLTLDELDAAARRRFGLEADCKHSCDRACPELPAPVFRLPLSRAGVALQGRPDQPRTGTPARQGSAGPMPGPVPAPGSPGPRRNAARTMPSSQSAHSKSIAVAP